MRTGLEADVCRGSESQVLQRQRLAVSERLCGLVSSEAAARRPLLSGGGRKSPSGLEEKECTGIDKSQEPRMQE